MRILAKFPTRGRPKRFIQTLSEWAQSATNPRDVTFLVSYDNDDETMTEEVLASTQGMASEVKLCRGESKDKIAAINANIDEVSGWQIVIVISDDFFVRRVGWDDLIRDKMTEHFPDTDGSLWIYDGAQKKINTLPCLGLKYYQRFGFIYNPAYKSFFCDDEQTAIGLRDSKLVFIGQSIASHEHPAWLGGMKPDATYQRNNKYWNHDKELYARRKSAGFPA